MNYMHFNSYLVFFSSLPTPSMLFSFGLTVADDAQLLEEMSKNGVEDEEHPYQVSAFRTFCPVAYYNTGLLTRGSPRFAAVYFNFFFMFTSQEMRDMFLCNPHKYLQVCPTAPCRLFLGGYQGGRTQTLLSRLDRIFGAKVVQCSSLESLLPKPGEGEEQLENNTRRAQQLADAVARYLADQRQFVVTGFPRSSAELEGLAKAALPCVVVIIEPTLPPSTDTPSADDAKEENLINEGRETFKALATAADHTSLTTLVLKFSSEDPMLNDTDEKAVVGFIKGPLQFPVAEALHTIEESDKRSNGLGYTRQFCPVTLKRTGVLFPGYGDLAVLYREQHYHFSSEEARLAFMSSPFDFITPGVFPSAPPPRILVLGGPTSGKTLQCRRLLRRVRLFHMSFHERLRELAELVGETHGETIKAHLADPLENPLPPDVAVAVVQRLWMDEPFKSTGFVLEGFPRNEEEARAMVEAGLYPDVVVILNMSVPEAIKRLLPGKMAEFMKQRAATLEKREIAAKTKAEGLAAHRKAWDEEQAEKRAVKEKRKQEMGDEYESDGEPDEEYRSPEEEEEEEEAPLETENDARERFKEEITQAHEGVTEGFKALTDVLHDELRLPVHSIDGGLRDTAVWAAFERVLKKYTTDREGLFISPYKVSMSEAATLLQRGRKRLSHFGEWCPVRLHKGLPFWFSPKAR